MQRSSSVGRWVHKKSKSMSNKDKNGNQGITVKLIWLAHAHQVYNGSLFKYCSTVIQYSLNTVILCNQYGHTVQAIQ